MARFINRSAFVLQPKKPFIDWAVGLEKDSNYDLRKAAAHIAVYLVAPDPKEEAETAPIELYYKTMFEAELNAWTIARAEWPKNRTLKLFREWFKIFPESIIRDLATTPIEIENLELEA